MKIYSTEMMLCGTIYVVAKDRNEAFDKMREFATDVFYLRGSTVYDGDINSSMRNISLSPAFTGHGLCEDTPDAVELVDYFPDEEEEDA